jgi:hypothetical protein
MDFKQLEKEIAKSVNRLNRKTEWTPQDIGEAQFLELANATQRRAVGKEVSPLFKKDVLAQALRGAIERGVSAEELERYSNLHYGLSNGYNLAQAQLQQFYHGYYRSLLTIRDYQQSENIRLNEVQQPLILTKKQLRAVKAEIVKARSERKISLLGVIYEMIYQYANNEKKAPKAVKAILEEYKKTPCTNQKILGGYCRALHLISVALPNGKKLHEANSYPEWIRAYYNNYVRFHKLKRGRKKAEIVAKAHYEEKLKQCLYWVFQGVENFPQEYEKATGEKIPQQTAEIIFSCLKFTLQHPKDPDYPDMIKGFMAEMFDETVSQAFLRLGLGTDATTFIRTDLPKEDFTKLDALKDRRVIELLSTVTDLMKRPDLYDNPDAYKRTAAGRADFEQEYKALYSAVKKEVLQKVQGAKDVPETDYLLPLFTVGEIAQDNIIGFSDFGTVHTNDIIQYYTPNNKKDGLNRRETAQWQAYGVAVLEDSKAPEYRGPARPYSLMARLEEVDEEKAADIKSYTDVIINPAIAFVLAYNRLLDILAEVYKIPAISFMQLPLQPIKEKIETHNEALTKLYFDASQDIVLNMFDNTKVNRGEIVKRLFKLLDINQWQPERKEAERIKAILEKGVGEPTTTNRLGDLLPMIQALTRKGV